MSNTDSHDEPHSKAVNLTARVFLAKNAAFGLVGVLHMQASVTLT